MELLITAGAIWVAAAAALTVAVGRAAASDAPFVAERADVVLQSRP